MVVAELPTGTHFPESGTVATKPTQMWIGSPDATVKHCGCLADSFYCGHSDHATQLKRLLRILLDWGKTGVRAVLCYEGSVRFSGGQRRTMDAAMTQWSIVPPKCYDLSDLTHTTAIFTEGLNDWATIAAIRNVPEWNLLPNTHFAMMRVHGDAVHRGTPSQLDETREFFGFMDSGDPRHCELAKIGVFPVQYPKLRHDSIAGCYVLDEPCLTFAMLSNEQELVDVQARAYTVHADPSTGRVSSILSYITNASQRLALIPDLRFGIDHHRKTGHIHRCR
ncbi:MAG: hypothetical protein QM770_01145 [Tepidisphaeraceae bacterium]